MNETARQQLRRAIVIHSPHSGAAAQLSTALAYLQRAGIAIEQVISIAKLDNLPPQGDTWRKNGIDLAIAAGGDGLIGGVITHIAESGLPLGIFPLGTSNDIARSLSIPHDLSWAAEVIAQGREQEIDIGYAQPAEQTPHTSGPPQPGPVPTRVGRQKHGYFAHALTTGLNVQFARLATNIATRQRYGRLTYPFAALEALRNHQALEVHLHFEGLRLPQDTAGIPVPWTGFHKDPHSTPGRPQGSLPYTTPLPPLRARPYRIEGQVTPLPLTLTEEELLSLDCRALQVAVINAPIFGGQWQLAIPGANLADRLLDIIVFQDIDLTHLSTRIARLFGLKEQQASPVSDPAEMFPVHHPAELSGIPGIHHLQARGVTITTQADPQDVTLDGEVRGQTPVYVRVADERLRVIVPQ